MVTVVDVTTEFVRRHYAQGPTAYHADGSIVRMPTPADVEYAGQQFDVWLTAHDEAVRADMQPREAAPSDTDREAARIIADQAGKVWANDAPMGTSLPRMVADALTAAGFSRPQPVQVEVTEAMVERALIALMRSEDVPTGVRPHLVEGEVLVIRERCDAEPIVRAALAAALGGGE